MPTAGARALFPASRPRLSPHAAATTIIHSLPRPRGRKTAVRTFRSSRVLQSRPGHSDAANEEDKQQPDGKPGGEDVVAAERNNESCQSGEPTASPTADARKGGALKTQGLGFGRSRVARKTAEGLPPVAIPVSFMNLNVSLAEEEEENRILIEGNELQPLLDRHLSRSLMSLRRYRDNLACFLGKYTEELTSRPPGTESNEEAWKRLVSSAEKLREPLIDKLNKWYGAALVDAMSVTYQGNSASPDHLRKLRELYQQAKGDITGVSEWSLSPITSSGVSYLGNRWLAGVNMDEGPDPSVLYGDIWARMPKGEFEACVELLAAVKAGLADKGSAKDFKRPTPILAVLNYKGANPALAAVRAVAKKLAADVVHLDARVLAVVVGRYLGQTFWSRDSVSMLGFDAAEATGRLASSSESSGSGSEQTESTVTLTFSRAGSIGPRTDAFLGKEGSESRWDDIKLRRALEDLVRSADRKREQKRKPDEPAESARSPLIIHIHDYVEISSLNDAIVQKLRLITERMWQEGRKVIVVGSTSSDVKTTPQWRDQVSEVAARDDHHIIGLHTENALRELMAKLENVSENLANIQVLLQESDDPEDLEHKEFAELVKLLVAKDEKTTVKVEGLFARHPGLAEVLSDHVHDASWCRRVATLILSQPETMYKPKWERIARAIGFVTARDGQWKDLYPDARPPYFSPLAAPPSRFSLPFAPSGMDDLAPRASGGSSNKNYDQYEKRLLSGLINAKDLHITFDEVVVPPETKESIKTLTSLSLVRPDAFSYGVLKAERIPGCLLYGPPGTGKTLLAKAVAKESGANMLEVSAASINEMWVGQSEKNVRALFSLARKMAPMVIFLDEGDALLGARSSQRTSSGRREIISEFLREWDGMSDMRAFIMVATNRPFDLDEAILRRLPRKILVDLPLRDQRAEILRVMLRDEDLDPSVDIAGLAAATELYSGSDLKNLCVAAAMEAVRDEERARAVHSGPEPFVLPARRILTTAHFDKGLRDISASISEDMDSLKAIRKFDEQYGDAGRRRRGRRSVGFEVMAPGPGSSDEARVRQAIPG